MNRPDISGLERRAAHATLITGGTGAERKAFADRLAAARVCSGEGDKPCGECRHCMKSLSGIHPDITYIRAEKQRILVDEARAMRSEAYVLPGEAEMRVFIIENAETMNDKAQNAVLKILEEPPPHSAFILTAASTSGILPTVLSRCAAVRLGEDTAQDIPELSYRLADTLAGRDRYKLAIFCRELEKQKKEQLPAVLDGAAELLRAAVSEKAAGGEKPVSAAAASLTNAQLLQAMGALRRISAFCDLNIGSGHISGLVNAYCWEAIH